jgi:hypothetical protein
VGRKDCQQMQPVGTDKTHSWMAASTRSLDKGPAEEEGAGPRPKKDMTVWREYACGRASRCPIKRVFFPAASRRRRCPLTKAQSKSTGAGSSTISPQRSPPSPSRRFLSPRSRERPRQLHLSSSLTWPSDAPMETSSSPSGQITTPPTRHPRRG